MRHNIYYYVGRTDDTAVAVGTRRATGIADNEPGRPFFRTAAVIRL